MKLKKWQINKIIELFQLGFGVETIAKKRRHSKNTVRRYLRLAGYLQYPYPPNLHTGPPSIFDRSTWSTNKPNNRQQGGWFYKELGKKDKLLEDASKREEKREQEAIEKNEENKKVNEAYKETKKELEDLNNAFLAFKKQVQEERQQKNELIGQMKEELLGIRQEKKDLIKRSTEIEEILQSEKEDRQKKDKTIEELEDALKQAAKTPVTPQLSSSPQIQSTRDASTRENEKTDTKTEGVDWIPIALFGTAEFIKKFTKSFQSNTRIPENEGFGNNAGCRTQSLVDSGISCFGAAPNKFAGKTTITYVLPLDQQNDVIQSDVHDKYSGEIPITTVSGTSWSGACFSLNGEAHNPRCEPVLTPQGDVTFSSHSSVTSGVELITNIPGLQCSTTYVSSHLENLSLQDANVIYPSSPIYFPSYCYISLTPPEHPSESLLWQQILKLDEEQFKQYLKRYFEHLGYQVTLMKSSHDWGVDMIIERGWEKILIQLKQWKDNVGPDAIRQVYSAINHYKATRGMVICTSSFTKNALELASENKVECWDAKQLLSELYKHDYLLPPE